MAKINWTIQAKDDLISIAEYIKQDSIKYARIQVKRIRERVKQLNQNPLSGRIVPEFEDSTLRELILGNYRIIYKVITPDRIDILTIRHSARRLDL